MKLRASRQAAQKSSEADLNIKSNTNRRENRYSQQESEFILRFIKAGVSRAEIGRTLDRNAGGIGTRYRDYLQYMDPDAPPVAHGRDALEDPTTAMVFKLANEGVPFARIAIQLGVSRSTVRRRYNAACPPEDRANGEGSPDVTSNELELIAQRAREGHSRSVIGLELGRSASSIDKAIRVHKLFPVRTYPFRFSRSELNAIRVAVDSSACLTTLAKKLNRDPELVQVRAREVAARRRTSTQTRRRWTLGERREIYRLHGLGRTITEIASLLNSSPSTILRILRQEMSKSGLEVPADRKQFAWSPEEESQLLQLREEERLLLPVIAKVIDRTLSSVRSKYRNLKDARLGRSRPKQATAVWSLEQLSQLIRLRDEERLQFSAIAETMGLSKGSVKNKYYRMKGKSTPGSDPSETAKTLATME